MDSIRTYAFDRHPEADVHRLKDLGLYLSDFRMRFFGLLPQNDTKSLNRVSPKYNIFALT